MGQAAVGFNPAGSSNLARVARTVSSGTGSPSNAMLSATAAGMTRERDEGVVASKNHPKRQGRLTTTRR